MTLVDIELLESARGGGIAAALVRRLFADAAGVGKFVVAHVAKENPAREIWFHLGFENVDDVGAHYRIEWRPPELKK